MARVTAMFDQVAPASVDIHVVYEVIADPPVNAGRNQDKYALVPDKKPPKYRGWEDTVAATGVPSTVADAWLDPTALIAYTRNL